MTETDVVEVVRHDGPIMLPESLPLERAIEALALVPQSPEPQIEPLSVEEPELVAV